ncbi:MAG: Gfo/Idh/MocA family oxidoreductase [Acidobacteriia bacterium]|nr:Gfo/Idh/MocA family oxidoreductase [Terriglobia bacterium]MYG02319.1 Gfo/Idh/MocA family oxidoreductase [Terriglobia bacterium]MYK11696.1 Gfo/Idh/MocA family oxidoreductase [Terriglobia bacterium]
MTSQGSERGLARMAEEARNPISRRSFMGTGAATAVAAGSASAAAPSDRVNLGMIGVGGRGRSLLRGFVSLPDVNVSYICDADQASLERARQTLADEGKPQPQTTYDMRHLFDDPEVDAVVVATPDHWHAPATILACDAGKDVYVEKPPSHNIREGRLMLDAARRNARIVQVGTQSRSRPSTRKGIEIAHSGALGDVLMAKAWNVQLRKNIGHKPNSPVPKGVDYETWLGPAPWIPFNENRFHYNWHWHWHFGTGDAGNDGAHQLDIARWALGVDFPESASGMGGKIFFDDDQQTPDTMNVTFQYGGKAMIWEMRIWNAYGMEGQDNGVAVYGTDASIQIGRWNRRWGYKLYDNEGKLVEHSDADDESDDHMRNFIECVRTRELPAADIATGHLSAIHCHLANIVSRTGRTLAFDQETETIVGDPHANLYVKRAYRTHWSTPKGA